MKIKKIISYLFGCIVALISVIGFSNAEVIGISQSEWNSKPDSYRFSQSCDEVVWNEVYNGKYGIYLDNFTNPSSNPGPLYIWNYKILTRGNYLLYNNSNGGTAGNGFVIFNRDYLQSINWKVNAGQTVRHITTAEEVNGATFAENWLFDTPYIANGGAPYNTSFTIPNYRSNGTHPNIPTAIGGNGYGDAEFRTITLYDSDNNLNTTSNNRAIVECQKNVIRRCGDGILNTTYEQCDPNLASSIPNGYTCNASCQLVPNTPAPYCGDGIINQASEDCDPGSENFGNGCNSNCQLMTPNCTLTANPNQGNIPLYTTINGTTNGWWARITNLNFGDGQNIGNGWDPVSFPQNHTYSTVGTFYLTGTVRNIITPIRTGAIRPVAYCSINVITTTPPPTPYCGDEILQSNEQCDPGSGNFGNGCNSNCQLMTPTCTLTVNPNQGTIPLNTTINGTKPNWATYLNLNFGDGSPLQNNPTFTLPHTYNTTGTFNLTLTVQNNYNGQVNGTKPTATCSASVHTTNPTPQPYCGDEILQSNEQCDPGSGNFGNGCNSNCQLMTPICTLTVNPNQGTIPLNTTINGTKPNWATYLNLNFGDGSPLQNNPTFTLPHTYNTIGTFNLTLTVQNNYNGQVNGIKPTATCSASVTATKPGSPVPYLLKQQKTGGMANFTTNQINVEIGETITYKVNFGNSGTVAATGEVWDILPPCVNYLTSSIHLPNGVTYNGPTVGPVNAGNQTMVKYKNFRLQPGQGGYMLVQAQVRGTGMSGMTSCQNLYSYLNTGYFKFVGGNTLSSQVMAVRPQAPQLPHLTINKELLTAGDMTAGSTVVYKITLTNDGNATYHNAYILDVLPNAIQYQTSSIQNVTNYLFEEGTTGNNEYYFKYYNFNLNAGQSAIVYLTGVLKQGFNFNQTTNCAATSGAVDCEEFPLAPIPYVKKWQKVGNMDFTDETIQVQLGDTIRYKVDFANLGNSTATGQVKDVLPPCVKYVSSELHGVEPYQGPIVGQQGIQDVVLYKNFPLAAGQTGYMLVKAEIRENVVGLNCSDTRSYLNTGYFRFTNGIRLSDDVLAIREESAGSEVIFDKTGNKKLMHPGEGGLEFYITVTNKGPNPISNIYVDDIRPHEDCIIYKGWSGDESLIEYIDPLRRHYIGLQGAKTNYNLPSQPNSSQTYTKGILYAGQSFNFTIFASVKNDPSCVGHYINKAILTYTEGGETHTLEDDYDFEVIDDNPDFACKSLTSSGSIVMLNDNGQGSMKFRCEASDSNPHNIAIYCGNGRSDSVSNQSSFEYTCRYSSSEEGANYNAYCLVDGQEPTNPACIKKIGINPGLYGDCGNGIIEAGEDCDLKSPRGVSVVITDYLDAAQTIWAGQYEGNYCKNCKIMTGNNFVYEPAECLYSDTPISVMENEIMPFWWRLWLKDNQLVGDNGCYTDASYSDSYEKGSSSNSNSSLSPRSKGTLLKKSSMKCTFAIYNGSNKLQGTTDPVQTFTLPCFNKQENFNTLAIYKYFIKNHQTENFNGGTEILNVNTLLNGNQSKKYGEYKLVLENVDYEYCDKTVGQWKKGKRYGAVCEVDFAVTKPYIIQISTFGVNPVGSNGVAFLDDYDDMNGNNILGKTDLSTVIRTDNDSYAIDSNVRAKFDEFKNKYEKLALKIDMNKVKINGHSLKSIFGSNVKEIKKVPNQSIYFIKGDKNDTLVLSQDQIKNFTSAYTIVVEGMNVKIKGNVLQYAMIVTDKQMEFEDNGEEGNMSCADGGQVVQGIYVALDGFKEINSSDWLRNRSENELWCPWGGLHVKGVLIGDDIENIMKAKRSQLNGWFTVKNTSESSRAVLRERRDKIINGASLLIEYNPGLWKTLPPGAEIFTESLEVYRR